VGGGEGPERKSRKKWPEGKGGGVTTKKTFLAKGRKQIGLGTKGKTLQGPWEWGGGGGSPIKGKTPKAKKCREESAGKEEGETNCHGRGRERTSDRGEKKTSPTGEAYGSLGRTGSSEPPMQKAEEHRRKTAFPWLVREY